MKLFTIEKIRLCNSELFNAIGIKEKPNLSVIAHWLKHIPREVRSVEGGKVYFTLGNR